MRILFFGDIVGKVGRAAVHLSLKRLKSKYGVSFAIGNAENASHGRGLTKEHYRFLTKTCGFDALTLGNHWRDKTEIDRYIENTPSLVRPLNLLDYEKGMGSRLFVCDGVPIRVTNILGTALMKEEVASPYVAFASLLNDIEPCIHIVDYHAETTSEKITFAHYFDGQASAFLGTHTHVQSADARLLMKGSAFQTDVGMCGDPDGVIGFTAESVISKIVEGSRKPFELKEWGKMMVNALLLDVDPSSCRVTSLKSINFTMENDYEENIDS